MIIRVEDVRKAGYCVRNLRSWFREHNLDANDFLKNGIDVEKLEPLNDAIANRVIELKRQREDR